MSFYKSLGLKIVVIFIFFVIFNVNSTMTYAEDDFFEDEQPLFPIVSKDEARTFGTYAVVLVLIGGIYIVIKRSYIYMKKYLKDEKYSNLVESSKKAYMRSRKPLFYVHLSTNTLATLVAIIHGLSVELEGLNMVLSGIIATVFMLLLTLSGFVIWKKFWPFWSNRDSKKLINAVHRQWLFSAALIILLGAHLFVFND
ncbi:MAG: hypothetical protein ACW981_20925 [Candidatus Hodarchaeales archaeon]|jgi:H+/Cl- antiporter ClcA